MAATGYTPIQLYYSSTPTNVPVNTNLVNGELAINIADGKLFYKDSGGTVQVLATKDTSGGTFSGTLTVNGTSAAGASLRLYEDTDNGTNYVSLQAPSNIASNVTFTLPSADGTNGQALITNGSGALSFGSAGISTGKSIAMAMIFGF